MQPVHQAHKEAISFFFQEGRKVFDRSNPAALAMLMAAPDRPGSLYKLFR
jgi:hypothetical protein